MDNIMTTDNSEICNLSKEEIIALDKEKLLFALDESRLFLESILEKVNRLSNKGFTLLGIIGGVTVFVLTMIFEQYSSEKTIESTHIKIWFLVPVILCMLCWIYTFIILLKGFLLPTAYPPKGSQPKNLLLKEVFNCNFNMLIVNQMKNYHDRIDKIIKRSNVLATSIEKGIKYAFYYPLIILTVFSIILGLCQFFH
jgi:membrane-associated HD superfamily phosphohydrolase